jgi:hypothetical protein
MLARHRLACAAIVFLTAGPAWAGDLELTGGASEAVALPHTAHLGVYPYAAVSIVFPYTHLSVTPGLGLEYSPDTGHWGFMGSLTVEVPITPRLGGDVIVAVAHDQAGSQWRDAQLLVGGGLGVSIATKQFVTSPSICIYTTVGSIAWSLVPGISVSRVF